MAELTTIARPYAEAAFALAQATQRAAGVVVDAALMRARSSPMPRDGGRRSTTRSFTAARQGVAAACPSAATSSIAMAAQLRARADRGRSRQRCCRRSRRCSTRSKNEAEGRGRRRASTARFRSPMRRSRELKAALEKRFGKKIEATVDVDPALIGGARITVGDTVIDASGRRRSCRRWPTSCGPESRHYRDAGDCRSARREDTMQLNPSEISELIKSKIQNLDTGATVRTAGDGRLGLRRHLPHPRALRRDGRRNARVPAATRSASR